MEYSILRIIYVANILVAGWIGVTSLWFPRIAVSTVFQNAVTYSESIRLVGCLWCGIALLSIAGLWKPIEFSPILVLQLVYKSAWLLAIALPALINGRTLPGGMAVFFLIWVTVLPFVIPWKYLFQ